MFAGTGMIMTAVAPALAEKLAEESGYAPVFASAAAASSVAFALALRLRKPAVAKVQQSTLRHVLARASSLRMIAVLGTVGLAFGVMFAFSAPFALQLGIANVRGFFVAFALGAVFVRFGLGSMIDRLGYLRLTTVSITGYGISVIAMVLLAPGRLIWLGGIFGLSHGLFFPAFTAFMVGRSAAHERGRLMTLFNGAFNLGHCAVFILGVAAEHVGYRPVFVLSGTLVLLTPALLLRWPAESL
jgi:MFS family permease